MCGIGDRFEAVGVSFLKICQPVTIGKPTDAGQRNRNWTGRCKGILPAMAGLIIFAPLSIHGFAVAMLWRRV